MIESGLFLCAILGYIVDPMLGYIEILMNLVILDSLLQGTFREWYFTMLNFKGQVESELLGVRLIKVYYLEALERRLFDD